MRHSFVVLAATALLLAVACSTVDPGQPDYDGTMPPYVPPAAPAAQTSSTTYGAASAPVFDPNLIYVGLNEYRIDIPEALPAGRVTLRVTNYGQVAHAFGIRPGTETGTPGMAHAEPAPSGGYAAPSAGAYGTPSPSGDRWMTATLQTGQSATLVVDLKSGSYVAFCPVSDHASARGMTRAVTVP